MPNPLVTVVTPSYNQGHFIRATIESVLSQDYPEVEYIIMDGGSTDATASVAKDYASRLTFISEKDRGQSHALNKGFAQTRGEIIGWINSDDTLDERSGRDSITADVFDDVIEKEEQPREPDFTFIFGLLTCNQDLELSLLISERMSTGTGKTKVVCFSMPISVRVCK